MEKDKQSKLGRDIRKIAYSEVKSIDGSSDDSGEVWISPKHWKAMNDINKAIIVDIWHKDHSYSNRFPFMDMIAPNDTYSTGVTFNDGEDSLKFQAILTIIKEFKIPHFLGSYDEIRKKKEKLQPKVNI